ncbi:hypothetical protein QTP86_004675 [Hemibagrus guttatus]|nr:hypothetical protein QTP86_004675 [Hemibagrus guttatus]
MIHWLQPLRLPNYVSLSLRPSPTPALRMDPAAAAAGGQPSQNTSPPTDPAELRVIIVQQGALIRLFQDQVEVLQSKLQSASAAAPLPPRDPPAPRGESSRLAMPEKYDGSADRCRVFLRQCENFFAHQPEVYRNEGTKCALLLSLLTGGALDWASTVWDADPQIRTSFTYFAGMIQEEFEYPAGGKSISLQLIELCQGSDSAAYYAIKFRTLAAQSGWNDVALWAVFHEGLSPALQTELACREDATSLSQYVATAIRLDNLLHQHCAEACPPVSSRPRLRLDYPRPCEEAPEPMQLGKSRLTEREHQRHTQMRLCYYLHDPQISWHKRELVHCIRTCSVRLQRLSFQGVSSRERAASLPAHRAWDCAIDLLPNTKPPKGRVHPLSLPEARATEEYIEEALAVGHIRPSTSPAAAGFFFVGKKDGGLHPCINYRGLNAITVRYPYPLPLVPAALEQLRGARFFTKLDLRSAYNLVWIREGDEWKTAFHTTHGHYEYPVRLFGLTNAPAVFQSLINEVFQDILGKWVIAYIDDILVNSTSLQEHVRHVRAILSRLQQNHLYIKPEKCEFHRTTIMFLGYVILWQGVEMDLTKVRAVTEWPNPTTTKELQRFLGFANFYRRFIRNYSSVAGPLTSLLRGKPRRLSWSHQAQAAFIKLKDSFTMAPILHHPDPDLPFVVEVDASSSGIPGKLHPCAFFSRKLTAVEANYDVGSRELLSIKATLEEWRHSLERARHPFLVLTDHHNLGYLCSAKRLNPRQARCGGLCVNGSASTSV